MTFPCWNLVREQSTSGSRFGGAQMRLSRGILRRPLRMRWGTEAEAQLQPVTMGGASHNGTLCVQHHSEGWTINRVLLKRAQWDGLDVGGVEEMAPQNMPPSYAKCLELRALRNNRCRQQLLCAPLIGQSPPETGACHQAQTDSVTSCHLYFWGPIHLFTPNHPLSPLPVKRAHQLLNLSGSDTVPSLSCVALLVINLCTFPSANVLWVGSTDLQRVKGQSSLSPNTIKISGLQMITRMLATRSEG